MAATVQFDPEANALSIRLSEKPCAYTKELDDERLIDDAEDGTLVGVELLGVDQGVDLNGLPPIVGEVLAAMHTIKIDA